MLLHFIEDSSAASLRRSIFLCTSTALFCLLSEPSLEISAPFIEFADGDSFSITTGWIFAFLSGCLAYLMYRVWKLSAAVVGEIYSTRAYEASQAVVVGEKLDQSVEEMNAIITKMKDGLSNIGPEDIKNLEVLVTGSKDIVRQLRKVHNMRSDLAEKIERINVANQKHFREWIREVTDQDDMENRHLAHEAISEILGSLTDDVRSAAKDLSAEIANLEDLMVDAIGSPIGQSVRRISVVNEATKEIRTKVLKVIRDAKQYKNLGNDALLQNHKNFDTRLPLAIGAIGLLICLIQLDPSLTVAN